ncbi:hypothetical protein [Listeria monocytogenes]|uniref:hypothetical protein n=1 Tax=Listeria monocytogenes TaxID=1639 RepID=UPI0011EB815A|nr:hypothetical protein [Listeria monocytogenes]TYV33102.1 hypothetical protein FZ060_14780 [Listeria monocytogenes]
MEVKIGISKQLEEHQISLQQYLTRMAKQMEGTKHALSEEYVIQLLEEHYQRLQEQLQQMRPNTQETVEEENRSFIRNLVDYFVSILEKANRAAEWTSNECEGIQKRWTNSILARSQQLNQILLKTTEKVAEKFNVEEAEPSVKEMLESIVDTQEPEAPEEATEKDESPIINPNKSEEKQENISPKASSMQTNGGQAVQPESPSKREVSNELLSPEKYVESFQSPDSASKVNEVRNSEMSFTNDFGEAPPEDPYEEVLTEVFLSEQTAPENISPVIQAVQENTKETMKEIHEVISQNAEETSVVLTPERLTEILQERESNLLQVVQNMLDNQEKTSMQEALKQEKTSTMSKIKEAYLDIKQVVKVNTVDKVVQTKNHVALTLRKGVLHVNQKLYQLSIQLDEKLQERISEMEIENPTLLETYPEMQEAGFTLTVGEEPYLVRYTEEENQMLITSNDNKEQKIPYTEALTLADLEERLQQSNVKSEGMTSEEASRSMEI